MGGARLTLSLFVMVCVNGGMLTIFLSLCDVFLFMVGPPCQVVFGVGLHLFAVQGRRTQGQLLHHGGYDDKTHTYIDVYI